MHAVEAIHLRPGTRRSIRRQGASPRGQNRLFSFRTAREGREGTLEHGIKRLLAVLGRRTRHALHASMHRWRSIQTQRWAAASAPPAATKAPPVMRLNSLPARLPLMHAATVAPHLA